MSIKTLYGKGGAYATSTKTSGPKSSCSMTKLTAILLLASKNNNKNTVLEMNIVL